MATSASSIHASYAQALYETLIASVIEQLQTAEKKLAQIDTSDPEVQKKVKSALPKNMLPEVQNFLLVLVREGALDQLPSIVRAFEEYGQRGPTVLPAEVVSAVALSSEQQQRIKSELSQQYKEELDLHFRVDESLIGGLIIRVGDQVLDNSLRSRLSVIQRSMLSS